MKVCFEQWARMGKSRSRRQLGVMVGEGREVMGLVI
jgi:hypothetical protein